MPIGVAQLVAGEIRAVGADLVLPVTGPHQPVRWASVMSAVMHRILQYCVTAGREEVRLSPWPAVPVRAHLPECCNSFPVNVAGCWHNA